MTSASLGREPHERLSEDVQSLCVEPGVSQIIRAWADTVVSSRSMLLGVRLTQRGKLAISLGWIEKQLGVDKRLLSSETSIFDSIIQRMIDEEIIILGHSSIANGWRRRLLCWYEGLSDDEKLHIPIVANTISPGRCLNKLPEMANLKWARQKLPLVAQTFKVIVEDLKARGVIAIDYKPVAERDIDYKLKKELFPKADGWGKRLDELRAIPLSSIDDLLPVDPDRPFIQVFHMFAAASLPLKSKSGTQNYSEGFRYVSRHLAEVGFVGNEGFNQCISPNYLLRFRNFLVELRASGVITSSTANTLLATTCRFMKRAVTVKGIAFTSFIDVQGFDTRRETNEYTPYPAATRVEIAETCEREIQETNLLAADYSFFHGGCDPVDDMGHIKHGYGTLENARWIFENKLDCKRLSMAYANKNNAYEKCFCRILVYSPVPIADIYKSWGVLYECTSRVLAPYVIRLAQVTGLNADSLKTLDVDDFIKSHEVTKRSYLRYWKERSGGEKLLHLDLMKADFKWLSTAQSIAVAKIFADVIYLTRNIRLRAAPSEERRLFLYESRKQGEIRVVKSLENSTVINLVMNQFAVDHGLKDEKGKDLPISASRLRPSLVADLIDVGASIREIQLVLGHKDISTTVGYLDKLEFSKAARKIVDEALRKIHKESISAEEKSKLPITIDVGGYRQSGAKIIIQTGLVECRNVFDPPPDIKALPSYKEGNPCSLLNKCLSCRNCIITASNLPDLFAMRRDYRAMMQTSSVSQTPYARVILENLETLDSILTPSTQGFDLEQLEYAERLSEYILTSTMIEDMTL